MGQAQHATCSVCVEKMNCSQCNEKCVVLLAETMDFDRFVLVHCVFFVTFQKKSPGTPPERHRGYVFKFFGIALANLGAKTQCCLLLVKEKTPQATQIICI